jgi:DNA-binding CsgD family transcriptional regulator
MSGEPAGVAEAVALIRRHEDAIDRLRNWISAQPGGSHRIGIKLSPAEREVARMLVQGVTCVQMAATRGVTLGTITNLRARLYAKLGVRRHAEAVALLLSSDLDINSGTPLELTT